MNPGARTFYEATARQRIGMLLDEASFQEIMPPTARVTSPHLKTLGLPVALDDGVAIGTGRINGLEIFCAAQEPGFMGGAVGEVHGAKLTGILLRAARDKPKGVVLILDTGGVRLHEANAGLIAISEIQRAVFAARSAGVPVIALSAGKNGCYGGISIVARCCDWVIMTEEGRLSVSGPEVIESQKGVEEFDSRDKALVWRTMGGKHRYLTHEADGFARDNVPDVRGCVTGFLKHGVPMDLANLLAEHEALRSRLDRFGDASDAVDVWTRLGVKNAHEIPGMQPDAFMQVADKLEKI